MQTAKETSTKRQNRMGHPYGKSPKNRAQNFKIAEAKNKQFLRMRNAGKVPADIKTLAEWEEYKADQQSKGLV